MCRDLGAVDSEPNGGEADDNDYGQSEIPVHCEGTREAKWWFRVRTDGQVADGMNAAGGRARPRSTRANRAVSKR
jgi:hypothetical protein